MDNNPGDNELIEKCLNDKDRDAWEVFVRRYSRLIWNFIRRTFHSYSFKYLPEDIEDLYGSIFLSLLEHDKKKLRQFSDEYTCSVSTWLTTITIRMTIDYMRRDRTHLYVEPVKDDREIWDMIADSTDRADAYVEKRQITALLKKGFESLPLKDRKIYELLYKRGFSPEDAAKVLNMTVPAIYTRKHRIIEKIKKNIEDM